AKDHNLEISIEVSSVNKKNLEVHASMPREWQSLERMINEKARKHFQRGKLNVSLKITDLSETGGLSWDEAKIDANVEKIQSFHKKYNQAPAIISPELILSLAKGASALAQLPRPDDFIKLIETILDEAMNKLNQMRIAEGKALGQDITERLEILNLYVSQVRSHAHDALPRHRQLLMQRLEKAELTMDINDERLLKELAFFADKCDISEELTRLDSHILQMSESTGLDDVAIGRKMDFICQEINRELNTIASKTNLLEVTKIIIDSKNELERIREQVQNVE
ncbi:MAG: YicC/YloC family endoribonuclease, partial [Bdellovibrionota bacterium]